MALFKISKGSKANLPAELTEGFCWYTHDDSKFYIDHKDENGVLVRKALNAQEAEKLTGYDIATILNASDLEIPTSKAVMDAINASNNHLTADDLGIYVQSSEPTDAPEGAIWIDTANDPEYVSPTLPDVPSKTSDLINDSGFITGYTETDPTVPDWAKASSKPTYTKSEIGLGNVDNVKQYSANNPPPYPVTSVNGKTGAVTISALPAVSPSDNGKVLMVVNGAWQVVELNMSIDANGVVSM